jgi:hypothetical protein
MTIAMIGGAQAFMVSTHGGRREPIIVTVYDKSKGEGTPAVPVPERAITTLEHVMRTTGYPDLLSFLVMEPYIEFMDARVDFVLNALFDQDQHILLIRCDSSITAQAFILSARKHYQLQPLARGRSVAIAKTSPIERSH